MAWCKVIHFGKHTHNTHISYIYIHLWKINLFLMGKSSMAHGFQRDVSLLEGISQNKLDRNVASMTLLYHVCPADTSQLIVAVSRHRDHPWRWYQQYVHLLKPPKHQMISAFLGLRRYHAMSCVKSIISFPARIFEKRTEQLAPKPANWEFEFPALLFADKSTHVKYVYPCVSQCLCIVGVQNPWTNKTVFL